MIMVMSGKVGVEWKIKKTIWENEDYDVRMRKWRSDYPLLMWTLVENSNSIR